MCRALLYLGQPVLLDNLLFQPDSALVRQSYMPKMLHMLNLAGFGMRAWDPASADPERPSPTTRSRCRCSTATCRTSRRRSAPSCVLAHVRGVAYSHARRDLAAERAPVPVRRTCRWCWRTTATSRDFARHEAAAARARPARVRAPGPRHHRQRMDLRAARLAAAPTRTARPRRDELVSRRSSTRSAIIREERAQLGIALSSSVNLFVADGTPGRRGALLLRLRPLPHRGPGAACTRRT